MLMESDRQSKAGNRILELEADAVALERAFELLQTPARTAAHLDRLLSLIRERLDADICYLVQDVESEHGGRVEQGAAVGRQGWTNHDEWRCDPLLARKFGAQSARGKILSFNPGLTAALRGMMFGDEEAKRALQNLSSFFVIHIGLNDKLYGAICIGVNEVRTLTQSQENFLRRSAQVVQVALERAESQRKLERALQVSRQLLALAHEGKVTPHASIDSIEAFVEDRLAR